VSAAAAQPVAAHGLTPAERVGIVITLLLTAGAAVARYLPGTPSVAAFVLAGCALAGQAWLVSIATEQLGGHLGPALAGTLQATVGNVPELFVVLFALQAHQALIAQMTLLGSILMNALLVLGLVLVVGAARSRDGIMRFSPRLPNDEATLLLVASFLIVLLGVAHVARDPVSHHGQAISIVGAVMILIVYGSWMRQYLRSGRPQEATSEVMRLTLPLSLVLVTVAGVGSAFTSDWFVHALQPTIHQLHISEQFAGLVIVALAGNAVEHSVGIYLAWRQRAELAIAVVKTSVAQIAAFVFPLLVLVSLLTATPLTFSIAPLYIAALFGTAILVWQITGDGEATVFEGFALIGSFVVIATFAAFGG
jgi:Ca2+:H+ antiporter